jgi:hypothetical protein
MGAAIHDAASLNAVADDLAAAMRALEREGRYGALKAVEGVGCTRHYGLKRRAPPMPKDGLTAQRDMQEYNEAQEVHLEYKVRAKELKGACVGGAMRKDLQGLLARAPPT